MSSHGNVDATQAGQDIAWRPGGLEEGLLAMALCTFNTETSLCGTQMDQGIWRGHEPHDFTHPLGFYPAPFF